MGAGWEGFPLGVVEAHEYGYELAAVYAFVFLYFAVAGPGKFSIGSGDLADPPRSERARRAGQEQGRQGRAGACFRSALRGNPATRSWHDFSQSSWHDFFQPARPSLL